MLYRFRLCPLEILFEPGGQRSDTMRQCFVRTLFDRLARVPFGKQQRAVRIVTPAILVIEDIRKTKTGVSREIVGVVFQSLPVVRRRLFERVAIFSLLSISSRPRRTQS